MIILVCGGRSFRDHAALYAVLDRVHAEKGITCIIEGGQRTYQKVRSEEGDVRSPIGGADFWAYEWARTRGIPCETYEADWDDLDTHPRVIKWRADGSSYNALAGSIRNRQMVVEGKPDAVIAFPGSRGTQDMIQKARGFSIPVWEPLKQA